MYEFGVVLKKKINLYFNPASFLKAEKKIIIVTLQQYNYF